MGISSLSLPAAPRAEDRRHLARARQPSLSLAPRTHQGALPKRAARARRSAHCEGNANVSIARRGAIEVSAKRVPPAFDTYGACLGQLHALMDEVDEANRRATGRGLPIHRDALDRLRFSTAATVLGKRVGLSDAVSTSSIPRGGTVGDDSGETLASVMGLSFGDWPAYRLPSRRLGSRAAILCVWPSRRHLHVSVQGQPVPDIALYRLPGRPDVEPRSGHIPRQHVELGSRRLHDAGVQAANRFRSPATRRLWLAACRPVAAHHPVH